MGIHGEPVPPVQKGFEGHRREDSDERIHRETGNLQLRLYPVYPRLPGTPETPVALQFHLDYPRAGNLGTTIYL